MFRYSEGRLAAPTSSSMVRRRWIRRSGIVLENDVVFGSVNANRSPQETATEALDTADPTWLSRLLTRRIPLDSWTEGLERRRDDVKVVVQRN